MEDPTELTETERRRIYLEEKARIESIEEIQDERKKIKREKSLTKWSPLIATLLGGWALYMIVDSLIEHGILPPP